MKKYAPIISSIIVALICIIGKAINQRMDDVTQLTYNGVANLLTKTLILFFVGICIGWNIWVLYQYPQKIAVIASIILNVFIVLFYFFMKDQIFLYPIALVGVYVFLLLNILFNNKGFNG